jgi:plasmid stability protein
MSDERLRAAVRSENELAMTDLAFDGLRIAMVNELVGSEYDEAQKREHLYHGLKALDDVRNALRDMVRKGRDEKAIAEAAAKFATSAGQ